jgi:hypothetical protein
VVDPQRGTHAATAESTMYIILCSSNTTAGSARTVAQGCTQLEQSGESRCDQVGARLW